MAHLKVVAASDAKARAKDYLTRALDALAVAKEDGRRLEAKKPWRKTTKKPWS